MAPVFATLHARPEPDRDALFKAQGIDPKGYYKPYDALRKAVGHVFTEEECSNFFKAAEYGAD
ncbi:MAG: hypothetical protein ACK5MY_04970 [Jhaorihella sp.]